jgi:hypothetical protein
MARARNIKPGLYKNEDLAECSVWARYIFPGLWMLADREGRLEDRPKRIKAELLPFDTPSVEPLLAELAAHKFLVRYQIEGASFIQITEFKKHQTPHYSEKPSVIKPPPLQEKERDISPRNSEKQPAIKRESQPPDSLIPDSLLSDSPNPEKKKHKGNGSAQAPFVLPDWIPKEHWDAWIDARTKCRHPANDYAKRLAIRKLENFKEQGHPPAQVLMQSAFNGWSGLFPPREVK